MFSCYKIRLLAKLSRWRVNCALDKTFFKSKVEKIAFMLGTQSKISSLLNDSVDCALDTKLVGTVISGRIEIVLLTQRKGGNTNLVVVLTHCQNR